MLDRVALRKWHIAEVIVAGVLIPLLIILATLVGAYIQRNTQPPVVNNYIQVLPTQPSPTPPASQ